MRFLSPKSLSEAFDVIDNSDLKILIASGMTHLLRFYPSLPDGLPPSIQTLLHVGDIESLAETKEESSRFSLGAAQRLCDLSGNSFLARYLSGAWDAARQTSTPQIRNRRSLGGELAWGSYHSPLITALMSFDTFVRVRRSRRSNKESGAFEENIPLEKFYTDSIERKNANSQTHFCRKADLEAGDLILKVFVENQDFKRSGHFSFFKALSPKISTENSGVVLAVSGVVQNATLIRARFAASGVWMSTLRDEIPLEGIKLKPNLFLEKLYQWCERYPFESYRRTGPSSKELGLIIFGLLKDGFSQLMGGSS
jgi:CO/xanthine dehydrogenase FAD-binding subunit